MFNFVFKKTVISDNLSHISCRAFLISNFTEISEILRISYQELELIGLTISLLELTHLNVSSCRPIRKRLKILFKISHRDKCEKFPTSSNFQLIDSINSRLHSKTEIRKYENNFKWTSNFHTFFYFIREKTRLLLFLRW